VQIDDRVATSGQPTAAQLKSAAMDGVQVVINLVPGDSQNVLPREAEIVKAAGMAYYHVPVSWQNPQESDFEKFAAALKESSGRKVLIHCAANYRATAFYSVYALQELKWTAEQADQLMAHFWKPGEYPVWDNFIQRLRENIAARGK
jgi:uncharacterized protein (TIGR01244 family)